MAEQPQATSQQSQPTAGFSASGAEASMRSRSEASIAADLSQDFGGLRLDPAQLGPDATNRPSLTASDSSKDSIAQLLAVADQVNTANSSDVAVPQCGPSFDGFSQAMA